MTKKLEGIIKTLTGLMVGIAIYSSAQFGMYKLMEQKLQKTEEEKGVEYTLEAARNTISENTSPINYLVIPGYRLALVDYIEKQEKNL